RFLPLRDSGSPIAEDRGSLCRRAFLAWNGEDVANAFGQRIGDHRSGCGSRGDAEPPQVVVHVVVAVPAAVILLQVDVQHSAAIEAGNLLGTLKDGFAILVAAARTGIDAPRGLAVGVDGHLNWASDALVLGLVVKVRLQRAVWLVVVRGCAAEFDLRL